MPERPPRVLAVLPSLFPSTIICVAKPLERLHRAGRIVLDLTLQCVVARHRVERADIVVLCHSIDPRFASLLAWIRECHKPLVYDLDDNLLEAPDDIPGLGYLREPARRELLATALRQADVVRVYSPDLQRSLAPLTPHVELVSGPLDWSLVPDEPPPPVPGRVRIVYATSRRQDRIGEMITEPLRRVLDEDQQAELTIWGPRLEPLAGHPRVRFEPFLRDYDRFFARFARAGFDIGLAPLPDDAFHRGKSNLKFREYAACGVAGVYSDTPVYNSSVVDGETGLLAGEQPEAWRSAIGRLVADRQLRGRIACQAREQARREFTAERTDADWMRQVTTLLAARRPSIEGQRATADQGDASGPLATLTALLRHLAWLCASVPQALVRHGIAATVDRARSHGEGLVQLMVWKLRSRLQARIHARAGRS